MKRLTLLLLSFLGMLFASYGQDNFFIMPTPSAPPSPQSEAFKLYGDYSVNYSTGVPSISIPLYEINHHGYKLPLSLNYFPSPLKPGYNYDVFGQGWGLSVSSSISRKINFAPDEESDFLVVPAVDGGIPFGTPCNPSIGFSAFYAYNLAHDDFNAVLPDGSSFDFYIEKNTSGVNVAYISNGRPVKITPTIDNSSNLTGFTIIDENGVKYTFYLGDYMDAGPSNPYAGRYVSWHLTQIDLPNSSEPITFSYSQRVRGQLEGKEPEVTFRGGDYYMDDENIGWNHNYPTVVDPKDSPNIYNMLLPDRIHYGDNLIMFSYADNSGELKNHNYVTNINLGLKSVDLHMVPHNVTSNTFPLMILDSIKIKDPSGVVPPQIYKCNYQDVNTGWCSTDHWGNLISGNLNNMGNFTFYAYNPFNAYPFMIESDAYMLSKLKVGDWARNPGGDHGLLTALCYPTGGKTAFSWERNQFQSHTDADGNYHVDNHENSPTEASSFRIKEIDNYTAEGVLANKKSYEYGKQVWSDGSGSYVASGFGEAVVDPNIFTYMDFQYTTDGTIDFPTICRGDFSPIESLVYSYFWQQAMTWQCTLSARNFRRLLNGRPQVLYPEVTEYQSSDADSTAGKTVYKYNICPYLTENGYIFFEPLQYYNNNLEYLAQPSLYNKLNEKLDYKRVGEDYQLIKKEDFYWDNDYVINTATTIYSQLHENYYYVGWGQNNFTQRNPFDGFNFNKHLYYSRTNLGSKSTVDYTASGDSITTFESNNYNTIGQLYIKSLYASDNSTRRNFYKYPNDYASNVPWSIQKMKERNILSPVTESSTSFNDANQSGEILTAGYKVNYKEYKGLSADSLILPNKDYELVAPNGGYVPRNEILSYTTNGNPLEVISKEGVHTCFIWAYHDSYIVASIANASYNTNGDIVSGGGTYTKSNIDAINGYDLTASGLVTLLNSIRTTLPSATVSTYTYLPTVGITSKTDPNGITTSYEYDGLGRLKTVFDNDNNVTGQYKYHDIVGVTYTAPPPPPTLLSISPSNEALLPGGGSDTIFVKSNKSWTVSVSDPWIMVSSTSGTNNGYFILSSYENLNDARSGTVTVSTLDSVKRVNVTERGSNYFIQPGSDGVGDYSTPMYYNPAFVSFSYTIDPFNLYNNYYVQVQSPAFDPNPVSISIYYCDESGWLDFSYDEGSNSLSFWATNTPLYTQYAMVFVSSDTTAGSVTRCFWVKIGY
jgi:YD repeat-containing protein